MVMKINDSCVQCGACIQVCPNKAIVEEENINKVLREKCTECVGYHDEPQCKMVCPMGAIDKDPEIDNTHEELLEKYKKLKQSK